MSSAAADTRRVRPGLSAWLQGGLRRAVLGRLAHLRDGELVLREEHCDPPRETRVGRPLPGRPALLLQIHSPRFWAAVAAGGSVSAGESYMAGEWSCAELPALVALLVRNREVLEGLDGGLARLAAPGRRLWHRLRDNTLRGSRRNIAEHYDLGNEFYELWLDETLTYSCALFEHEGQSLAEAQRAKIDTLLEALDLSPGERLLEIGTGWGALAERAATRYGAQVTTLTISRSQHEHVRARLERAGLTDRVDLRLMDWRELSGTWDKLVSVEMVEAVGARHHARWFETLSRCLAPDGRAAIQAILIQDRFFEAARREVDFIQRHVFPGSCIPSISALLEAARDTTDLRLVQLTDLTPHYVTTLAEWRRRFHARAGEVSALGFPPRFLRLWDFYLAYCEGGFAERQIGVAQFVFDKPRSKAAVPRRAAPLVPEA